MYPVIYTLNEGLATFIYARMQYLNCKIKRLQKISRFPQVKF